METDAPEPDDTLQTAGSATHGEAVVVAGLGASAGGVEALKAFFSGLPEIDGIAFVVILHLDPNEESRLADVLQQNLPLPVTQVVEAVDIEPGHVYVIPPDKNLLARDGRLVLEPIEEERVRRRPVDHFFRTLAHAYGERAVGVVLSGTGANGTVGVRALKEAGGFILAQDPADALFEEMPRTAIASGVVDAVGPAGTLATEVAAYAHRIRKAHLDIPADLPEDGQKALQGVLAQLRARTGHDFAHYKRATILRRLDRRLHVTGVDTLGDYLILLRDDATEAEALLDDLLISVTNFFRDPSAFALLAEQIPDLFDGKGPHDEVRAWVAGCATGEEAYSVAMLLMEHAATLAEPPRVQVFATDLSDAAVRTARTGAYPASIEADVPPERLRRFFTRESGRYHVSEPLREAVLFAPHSLLVDPPFSRIDLLSCRNVLIYLQRELQQRVLSVFHYALRPGGLLFLGTSESADGDSGLFGVADKSARLYRRLDVETPSPALPRVTRVLYAPAPGSSDTPAPPQALDSAPSETERVHRMLREASAPPSVLVGASGEVVHVSEAAAPFLQVPTGAPTQAFARVLRTELRAPAQTALFQARREDRPVASKPTLLDLEGEAQSVVVRARPEAGGSFVQIAFEVLSAVAPTPAVDADEVLAEALRQTQEQLQISVEEFETSREELRAQNEELQSINEELRSTAEELETSKEEAQSMSEELRTVNDELKAKVDETARAKGDLENLIMSTEIATLFLDRDLTIQRFTPHVRDLFHVLASDVGRPLRHLAQKFGGRRLAEDVEAVLERLEVTEREVEADDGRWYLVHARPYRTVEDRIDGVVVTFVDITRRKADESALSASADRAAFRAALADALRGHDDPIAVQARATRLLGEHLGASRVYYGEVVPGGRMVVEAGYTDGVTPLQGSVELDDVGLTPNALRAGRTLVVPPPAAGDTVAAEAGTVSGQGAASSRIAVPRVKDGLVSAVLSVHQSTPRTWTAAEVALVEETAERTWDAVERARAEASLRANEALFDATLSTIGDFAYAFDRDGRLVFANRPLLDLWQIDFADAVGKTFHELDYPPALADRLQRQIEAVFETGEGLTDETAYTGPSGDEGFYEYILRPLLSEDGAVSLVVGSTRDVTTHLEAAAALRQSEERLRQVAETVPDVLFRADPDGRIDFVNHQFEVLTGRPAPSILGETIWPDLVHPDDREQIEAAWEEAREQRGTFEVRCRLLTDDGACWVIVHAHPLSNDENIVEAWFGTLTDVDALASAETEVRRLNATLSDRVAERTEQVRQLSARLTTAEQEERRRIALVLHDDLQQQLAGLDILLGVISGSPASRKADLEIQASKILDDAQALTRSLASELSPPSLASENLVDTLHWLADRKRNRHQLEVSVEADGACRVPDGGIRALLYNAIRELLFNVVKHAGTGRATVRARRDGEAVEVVVEDDGDGFDSDSVDLPEGGLGLFSIRERIEMAGGQLRVDSELGRGTQVTITLPVDGPAGPAAQDEAHDV